VTKIVSNKEKYFGNIIYTFSIFVIKWVTLACWITKYTFLASSVIGGKNKNYNANIFCVVTEKVGLLYFSIRMGLAIFSRSVCMTFPNPELEKITIVCPVVSQ
jgi:hypothetical protein